MTYENKTCMEDGHLWAFSLGSMAMGHDNLRDAWIKFKSRAFILLASYDRGCQRLFVCVVRSGYFYLDLSFESICNVCVLCIKLCD